MHRIGNECIKLSYPDYTALLPILIIVSLCNYFA